MAIWKKLLVLFLILCLGACGETAEREPDPGRLKVICTTGMIGDAVRNLVDENVEVLTLMGNPGTKENEQGYKYHVIAYLKDLKYLDYKVIDSELRYQAEVTHKEEMTEKETAKAADKGDDQAPMFNKEHIEQLREAKILCTEDLF